MRRLFITLLLIPQLCFGAGTFTEFYCRSGGSNQNAGSESGGAQPGTAAKYTSTNGNWSTVTNIFTPVDGSTPASSITVNDFASVYLDGANPTVYVARVTAVAGGVNGGITLSSTIKGGTAPVTGATGRTIKVGGAWLGPNAGSIFPATMLSISALAVSNTTKVRINLKNDQTYTMNAGVTWGANQGSVNIQGYTTTAGDGGRATIDFTTTTGNLWTIAGGKTFWADLIWVSSATSGTGNLVVISAASCINFYRCVFHGARNAGLSYGNNGYAYVVECEAYDCNKANSASIGGFTHTSTTNPVVYLRSISHDHASGSNADGFFEAGMGIIQNSIADTCAGIGFNFTTNSNNLVASVTNSDAYNNTGDGIKWAGNDTVNIENCNLIKNGGWGINVSGVTFSGIINSCGFGAGTQANTSGTINLAGSLLDAGTITYASNVTPWSDPANGDFRVNLATANFVGRGAFTQTAASYTGTVGYPDVGSAQSKTGTGGTFSKEVSAGSAR